MKKIIIDCSVFLLFACGGTKNIATSGDADVEDITTAAVLKNYSENRFDFNTLAARMKVRYEDKKNTQSVTVSLRMAKDKTIWMSASLLGISLAKAMVTPDRVAYYEKISGTYFVGDFKFLSEYFGVDMDFDQLQRLLVGQTVYDLEKGKYVVNDVNNEYQITPKKQLDILNLFFFIEPDKFLLKNQKVTQPKDRLFLDVDYRSHQEIAGKPFPQAIFIEVLDKDDRTTIGIDYRSVDYNADVSFPFSIPSGYSEIKF